MTRLALQNLRMRLQQCRARESKNFDDIIFKSNDYMKAKWQILFLLIVIIYPTPLWAKYDTESVFWFV